MQRQKQILRFAQDDKQEQIQQQIPFGNDNQKSECKDKYKDQYKDQYKDKCKGNCRLGWGRGRIPPMSKVRTWIGHAIGFCFSGAVDLGQASALANPYAIHTR